MIVIVKRTSTNRKNLPSDSTSLTTGRRQCDVSVPLMALHRREGEGGTSGGTRGIVSLKKISRHCTFSQWAPSSATISSPRKRTSKIPRTDREWSRSKSLTMRKVRNSRYILIFFTHLIYPGLSQSAGWAKTPASTVTSGWSGPAKRTATTRPPLGYTFVPFRGKRYLGATHPYRKRTDPHERARQTTVPS